MGFDSQFARIKFCFRYAGSVVNGSPRIIGIKEELKDSHV